MIKVTVTVPATSANLSVGYDCIGMAININSSFCFSDNTNHRLTVDGCPKSFQNTHNLVYRAFIKGAHFLGKPVPNLKIKIDSQIPIARGLGSSASCIVSGLQAANKWFKGKLNNSQILNLAAQIEGHPDNVAPAVMGGLRMALIDNHGKVHTIKYTINPCLCFCVMIPNFRISTRKARGVLPRTMPYSEATYQMSHILLMMYAMKNGNIDQLKIAMNDKMHEPYRSKLIPGFTLIKSICKRLNSILYISGSGSTLMSITDNQNKVAKLIKLVKKSFPKWKVFQVVPNNNGIN